MRHLINIIFYIVARVLHATYRYRFSNLEHRTKASSLHKEGAFVLGLWHRNSFVGTLAHTYQKFCPLCSRSGDGQMVAFLCRHMGLRPVSGSSSRGGKEARNELLEAMDEGYAAAITVDGPKGPPLKSKNGIVDIAKKKQVAMLPCTAVPDRYWELNSWDSLRIPKPFAKISVQYGPPILVPEDTEGDAFEALRQQMDDALIKLDNSVAAAHSAVFSNGLPMGAFRKKFS